MAYNYDKFDLTVAQENGYEEGRESVMTELGQIFEKLNLSPLYTDARGTVNNVIADIKAELNGQGRL